MKRVILVAILSTVLILAGVISFSITGMKIPQALAFQSAQSAVTGTITGSKGPLAGVIVQLQGTPIKTTTAKDGSFTLNGADITKPYAVTAWTDGYYIGWVKLDPKAPDYKGARGITIPLKPLFAKDNVKYPWFSFEGTHGSASCGLCHREYKEWQADAHSQSASNQRFITMYRGTNVKGDTGQPVLYGNDGKAKLPDAALPYYGPGYKLDNPQRAGNCATCHTPVAAKISNEKNCAWSGCHTNVTAERSPNVMDPGVSPIFLIGDGAEGITCEFCHKIGNIILDPKTKMPLADMPGILSTRLYRPPDGEQIFFGTMLDVTRRVSYSTVETKSEFCAPCHYGVFGGVVGSGMVTGGVVIYNSYGEWLNSPYSDAKNGKTCQDCHMPVKNTTVSVFPEKGGIPRDYVPLHEHQMPGISDEFLMKNAVTLKNKVQHDGDKLQLTVSLTNDKTGHSVPTDSPTRQMILVVEALDANGKTLSLSQGPVNPAWADDYAKQPGKTFSKVLKDEWTGEMPTAAYWRPVTIAEDTRLVAMATDTTNYTFDLPAGKAAKLNIKVLYRRAPQALEKLKGWTDPDVLMEQETIQVER